MLRLRNEKINTYFTIALQPHRVNENDLHTKWIRSENDIELLRQQSSVHFQHPVSRCKAFMDFIVAIGCYHHLLQFDTIFTEHINQAKRIWCDCAPEAAIVSIIKIQFYCCSDCIRSFIFISHIYIFFLICYVRFCCCCCCPVDAMQCYNTWYYHTCLECMVLVSHATL